MYQDALVAIINKIYENYGLLPGKASFLPITMGYNHQNFKLTYVDKEKEEWVKVVKIKYKDKRHVKPGFVEELQNELLPDLEKVTYVGTREGKISWEYGDFVIWMEDFFPYEQIVDKNYTVEQVYSLGATLGVIHRRLDECGVAWPGGNIVDTVKEQHEQLATFVDNISLPGHGSEYDRLAVETLGELKESCARIEPGSLERHGSKLHGDYYPPNIFFSNHRVAAVIDWDNCCFGNRWTEVFRAMNFLFKPSQSGGLNLEEGRCFVDGYTDAWGGKDSAEYIGQGYGAFYALRMTDIRLLFNRYLLKDFRSDVFLAPNLNFLKWLKKTSTQEIVTQIKDQ